MSTTSSIESMSFEEALDELKNILRNIDTGEASLEDSISSFERGVLLKNHCENKLKSARMKIEKITIDSVGAVLTQEVE